MVAVAVCGVVVLATAGACDSNGANNNNEGNGNGGQAAGGTEFAQRVNALCEERQQQVDAIAAETPPVDEANYRQEIARRFEGVVGDYAAGVRRVPAPRGQEALYREYVELLDDLVRRFRAAQDDPAQAETLFNDDSTRLADIEEELGLTACIVSAE